MHLIIITRQYITVYVCAQSLSHVRLSVAPWTARLLCLWNFPGKKPGAGCHFLLPGNLPNRGVEPVPLVLLHQQGILYY